MTYWRCIKCGYTQTGEIFVVRFQCQCGQWCVDTTELMSEMKSKGDLTAQEVDSYCKRLQYRCGIGE